MISKRANGSELGGPERIDMFRSGHLHEQQAIEYHLVSSQVLL
jgi:hypothetical protein